MDIRTLTDRYAVSPQIGPGDLDAIKAEGFTTIICNRPDTEVTPDVCAVAVRAATEAAGLTFVENPVTHGALTIELLQRQAEAMAASDGPVLAYCASGNRSTIVWGLIEAGRRSADEIIVTAARAGYNLEGLRPHLAAAGGG